MANSNLKHRLSRTESTILADYARSKKSIDLPQGWVTFYRLNPTEIARKFPALSTDEIIKESRMKTEEESPA